MQTTQEQPKGEKRLLRVLDSDALIVFQYREKEQICGRCYLQPEMLIDDVKRRVANDSWIGKDIHPALIQLYVQADPLDKETLIGPLFVLDTLSKYLDDNDAILCVKRVQ